MINKTLRQPTETRRTGEKLVQNVKYPRVVCLYGDLGSGKTTFVQGMARGLGVPAKTVKSPTFVLMNVYRGKKGTLFHFDCYRASAKSELFDDISEALAKPNAWVAIEWADKVRGYLPADRIDVYLRHRGESQRTMTMRQYKKKIRIPGMTEIRTLFRRYHTPEHVKQHCAAVAKLATHIARCMSRQGTPVNIQLVRAAALLHDVVRVVDFRTFSKEKFEKTPKYADWIFWTRLRKKYQGLHHADVAHLLLSKKYPELATIIQKHKYVQLKKGFESWEEKIVFYADKRVKHDNIVSLKERIRDGRIRNAPHMIGSQSEKNLDLKAQKLEREIMARLAPYDRL
ncbi:MAG: tRNA (adenosine(37)-N6)-threonylcarbamoyltransferase complex ATPase subunit type 1 TsaE [Patescibacteria group bacterium]